MKKCGYSFWGYLGDLKYDRCSNDIVSTSDSNAFYSWCIIRELQKRGYEVNALMPDRDAKGYCILGSELFDSWLKSERLYAYIYLENNIEYWRIINDCRIDINYHLLNNLNLKEYIKSRIFNMFEKVCGDMEFILHEYRMLIQGRNDYDSIFKIDWQPDYLIQECIFEYCCKYNKKLIILDLDYKLEYRTYEELRDKGCDVKIFELGTKWQEAYEMLEDKKNMKQVYMPFDFDNIDYFKISSVKDRSKNLVYIESGYERDWCIDIYIPENLDKYIVYGNWFECGRDLKERWNNLTFGKIPQTKDMRKIYSDSISTILFAKEECCRFNLMTPCIIESIFYGTVPLFIGEYSIKTIKKYAGICANILTVRSKYDVEEKIEYLKNLSDNDYNEIIEFLRDRLKFMDVKNFVDTIEGVL